MSQAVVKCPDCGGDGKQTCHNPDHGFLKMVSGVIGANESACPCCGHSEDHKIRKYIDGKRTLVDCETCKGAGKVLYGEMMDYCSEFVDPDHRDDVIEHCID